MPKYKDDEDLMDTEEIDADNNAADFSEEEPEEKTTKTTKSKTTKKSSKVKKNLEIVQFTNEEDKLKALHTAIEKMEKDFGKGSVMKLGDNSRGINVEVLPTGSLGLDLALGVGGVPKGRIIEIYGPEGSGKTTLALHMVAEMQKEKGIGGYVDAEHALDPVYAQKLGVDINNLYVSQPDDGEQALEICEAMVRSSAIDIVIVDSVAALVPRAEIEGAMGDSHMGLQARLMSQALRKLAGIINRSKCIVIFINQLRDKIGGISYGPAETTTGGRALKFYSSVRIDIRKGEAVKVGDNIVGSRTKVKVAKNKVAPPFKTTEFDIMFGQGISRVGEVLDMASELNIINKSGTWYSYNDTRIGQGRDNAKKFLANDPQLCIELENMVRQHYGIKLLKVPVTATELELPTEDNTSKSEASKKAEATKKAESAKKSEDSKKDEAAETK